MEIFGHKYKEKFTVPKDSKFPEYIPDESNAQEVAETFFKAINNEQYEYAARFVFPEQKEDFLKEIDETYSKWSVFLGPLKEVVVNFDVSTNTYEVKGNWKEDFVLTYHLKPLDGKWRIELTD